MTVIDTNRLNDDTTITRIRLDVCIDDRSDATFWPRKEGVNDLTKVLRRADNEIRRSGTLTANSLGRLDAAVAQLQADIAQLYRLLGQANRMLSLVTEPTPATTADVPEFGGRFADEA